MSLQKMKVGQSLIVSQCNLFILGDVKGISKESIKDGQRWESSNNDFIFIKSVDDDYCIFQNKSGYEGTIPVDRIIKLIKEGGFELENKNRQRHSNAYFKVFASVPKSEITEKSLKVGQEWLNPKKEKLVIQKKWFDLFVVKDKFGDEKKMSPTDLVHKLKEEKFKLTKQKDIDHIINSLAILFTPYLNPFAVAFLLNAIKSFLKKKAL